MSRRNLAWLLGIAAVGLLSQAVFFRVPTDWLPPRSSVGQD